MDIINRIKSWFGFQSGQQDQAIQPAERNEPVSLDEKIDGFLSMLANSREDEISCDDVHLLLAEYAEAIENGEDPARLMPLVKHHLEMCHECDEELAAVLEILHSVQG